MEVEARAGKKASTRRSGPLRRRRAAHAIVDLLLLAIHGRGNQALSPHMTSATHARRDADATSKRPHSHRGSPCGNPGLAHARSGPRHYVTAMDTLRLKLNLLRASLRSSRCTYLQTRWRKPVVVTPWRIDTIWQVCGQSIMSLFGRSGAGS